MSHRILDVIISHLSLDSVPFIDESSKERNELREYNTNVLIAEYIRMVQ